jgi:hypothetical protein
MRGRQFGESCEALEIHFKDVGSSFLSGLIIPDIVPWADGIIFNLALKLSPTAALVRLLRDTFWRPANESSVHLTLESHYQDKIYDLYVLGVYRKIL